MAVFIALLIITTIVLMLPISKLARVKSVMCAATIAFAVALSIHWISPFLLSTAVSTPITLVALNNANVYAEGTEVWVKGVVVDDRWYPATHIFDKGAYWLVQDQMVGWRNYDSSDDIKSEITGRIPAGQIRTIMLEANPWRGQVEIRQPNLSIIVVDAYHGQSGQDFSVSLEPYIPTFANELRWGLTGFAFLAIFVIILLLYRKFSEDTDDIIIPDNHIWGMDILRILCIFTIVILHCTNNTFRWDFGVNQQSWYNYLYVNVATSFAVPSFFMLSGALLIRKNTSIKTVLYKRIINVAFPLLFWSGIYIVVRMLVWNESISFGGAALKMFFEPQYWHLWFMYPLIGLYFLLPFISHAYYNWDNRLKAYAGILLFVVPAVLFTIFQLTGKSAAVPWFALGFPELGLFVVGRILWDTISKRKIPWWISIVAVFFSFSAVCVTTYLLSMQQNEPVSFFGVYGNLFVTAFAISVCTLVLSLETFWSSQLSRRMKSAVYVVARLSMGIYFVHMIFLVAIGNIKIAGITLANNAGSLHNMLLGSVAYFICSAMLVFVMSKIPVIKKLVT